MIVVVGGLGGSGTRIIPLILQEYGFDFGETNYALDALALRDFYVKWLNRDREGIVSDFEKFLQVHKPDAKNWGFKNPNSILYWDVIYQVLPHAKYIHVLRNKDYFLGKRGKFSLLYNDDLSDKEIVRLWEELNSLEYPEGMDYLRIWYREFVDGNGVAKLLSFLGLKIKPGVENLIRK